MLKTTSLRVSHQLTLLHDQWKSRQVRSNLKLMLKIVLEIRDIIYQKSNPSSQTVSSFYYSTILKRLKVSVRCKRVDLWRATNLSENHANKPVQTSIANSVMQFLTKKHMTHPHMSYPWDFWKFKRRKSSKGETIGNHRELKEYWTSSIQFKGDNYFSMIIREFSFFNYLASKLTSGSLISLKHFVRNKY